ncbi:dihydrofolate reductase family protein [Actinomycetota bacterium]
MATIYCTATSLDGFIADDDESLSWLFTTPSHDQDPQGRYGDGDTLDFDRFIADVGALVAGANTVEWLRRELTKDGSEFAWPYPQPSWVVTHRDMELPAGVERFEGDVRALHSRMVEAAEGKDVWIVGGGDLAGQFFDAGLLDRVWVHVAPVVLGAGKPLLPRRIRLQRQAIERDGQLTAMLFDVVGPEPRDDGQSPSPL